MRKGYEAISDFIFMEDKMETADVILVAGSGKRQLAERATELYKAGYANYIVISGGYNPKINMTELEFLSKIAVDAGVPKESILGDDKAHHTFDNAEFSYEICLDNGIDVKKAILVCKAFHSRRAYMTYKVSFPKDVEILVSPIVHESNITKENWIHDWKKITYVMGEVEKIGKYFSMHIESLKD